MSRLPNAPLLEVIFELKWQIINKNDIVDFQYLHGDLYSQLRDNYKIRENLLPPEIPFEALKGVPAYRFRKNPSEYPLIQLGLGLLTVNTIDKNYYWDEFKSEIDNTLNCFNNVYPKFSKLNFTPSLSYIDFFEIDLENQNLVDFIEDNLNIKIKQSFIDEKENKINDALLTLNYQIGENTLTLTLRKGNVNKDKEGVIMQSKVSGINQLYDLNTLSDWIDKSHEISREIFKKIIKPDFYKTFN